ncbi:hypothetical protein BpHYR1_027808 [Brachionus plicatilis]|uniref:Uncharacterized protein n=1 Tax=Brachionus plicatilis TaxID=10195 RepID=A0A3M7P388_BRAPC|nr:hypothetical protein BpHYR1_027808 [Brachionus plicatilis]
MLVDITLWYVSKKLQKIIFCFSIFLAIISDSYSYASENYEPKPELDYFNFFKRRLKKYADFFRLEKVWSILKGFFYLVDSKNNSIQHINQLQDAKKASDFRSYLLNLNFDPVDIDTIFYQYNIYEMDTEKLDEFDPVEEESIVQRDTCNEIITKLDLTAKRIISLNSRKLTFCPAQTNFNFGTYEMDLQSIYSNKSFKLSGIDLISQRSFNLRAASSALPQAHSETNTVNDDVNNIDYDNVYTEFTTWKDYRKLKLELDNMDTYLNEIFNELLDSRDILMK